MCVTCIFLFRQEYFDMILTTNQSYQIWVSQQEIERLYQEQESIMRRQGDAQHVEALRQHINRERTRLAKLQYTVDILHQ
jgi:hypothetical protein